MKIMIDITENLSEEYKEELLNNGMFLYELQCSVLSWIGHHVKEKEVRVYEVKEENRA